MIVNNSSLIGGAEISLLGLLNTLQHEYSLTIAIPDARGDLQAALLAGNYKARVFPMKRFSKAKGIIGGLQFLYNLAKNSLRMARYVKEHNIDVIYANANQSILYAAIAGYLTTAKIIWHVRDNTNNKFFSWALGRSVHKIICISEYIFRQIPASENKKHLIHNGVDPNVWKPAPQYSLHSELGLQPDILLVGQVAQLIPWKNHFDFLKAAELVNRTFSNVHFVIIGADLFNENPAYISELKEYVNERHLNKWVSFIGYKRNVMHYMHELDVLIHCAPNEPFGRVIIEAMALEKPVVAYDSGGVKEIVKHGATGFLATPLQYDQLAEHVLSLLQNKNLRESFGVLARKEVIKLFNMETTNRMIKAVIDELCAYKNFHAAG